MSGKVLGGPELVPPLCRETPVSRTTVCLITAVFPDWRHAYGASFQFRLSLGSSFPFFLGSSKSHNAYSMSL